MAAEEFISLAGHYWDLAKDHGGVRPEVAFAQAAKETGFGLFGGVVDASFHNPCGMKTTAGGSNSDPNAHQRFASWTEGVTAHIDHLALYAGADGYPRAAGATPDPRHFPFLAGKANSVEALGGKWAPSEDYGRSIVADYLAGLMATTPET
jgi:N-acetylmuramoyl-L-alanine amidase